MTEERLPPVLDRMLRLWNGEPIDPGDVYAPTCGLNGTSTFTSDEIPDDIARLRTPLGDLRFVVDTWTRAEPWYLLRMTAEGVHHGQLETPLGVAAPSGLRLRLHGLEAFEVRDDRIVAVWLSWNWSEAYKALGASFGAPRTDSPAEEPLPAE